MFRKYAIGFLLLFLSQVGFGMTFVIGSMLTKRCGVSPDVLSFCRFAIAGLALLAISGATAHGRAALARPRPHDWLRMLWIGPVGTSVMAWCVFAGCARVSVANASMADALTPLVIFATAAILSRRISRGEFAGVCCGFVGALLVIQVIGRHGIALEAYSLGDAFILLSAATWGVYTVCGQRTVRRIGSTVFTTWTMLIGAVSIGLFLPFLPTAWPQDLRTWSLVAALALVSTLMPFWSWNAAQRHLPISVISVSAYFAPVVAMALAVLLLNEHVTSLQWLGTAFIVASATVETGRASAARRQPPTVTSIWQKTTSVPSTAR